MRYLDYFAVLLLGLSPFAAFGQAPIPTWEKQSKMIFCDNADPNKFGLITDSFYNSGYTDPRIKVSQKAGFAAFRAGCQSDGLKTVDDVNRQALDKCSSNCDPRDKKGANVCENYCVDTSNRISAIARAYDFGKNDQEEKCREKNRASKTGVHSVTSL